MRRELLELRASNFLTFTRSSTGPPALSSEEELIMAAVTRASLAKASAIHFIKASEELLVPSAC